MQNINPNNLQISAECSVRAVEPLNLWHHLSKPTQRRAQSAIKKFYQYFAIPGIGQLAGGLPCSDYFPFDGLDAPVAVPDRFSAPPNSPTQSTHGVSSSFQLSAKSSVSSRLHVPRDSGVQNKTRKIDTVTALQYGQAQGYPPLYDFLLHFTRNNLHPNIPYTGGPDIALTVGNTDGFAKCMEAFNNVWDDGDPVAEREGLLVEYYAYMTPIQLATARGMNVVPIVIDEQGMLAEGEGGLRDVLETWDYSRGRLPHLMYTVTIGQNPTSGVLSIERRQKIYELCQEYDILIIEDDPYWYLQYQLADQSHDADFGYTLPASHPFSRKPKSSGYRFLDTLQPSYITLDVDGRVIRLDTFSKTVAPGCRLGWITAQPRFIERFLRIAECSTQQPSGFVQSLIAELLMGPQAKGDAGRGGGKDGTGWNTSGFVQWIENLSGKYEHRMRLMSQVLKNGQDIIVHDEKQDCDEWAHIIKTTIYNFPIPMGGMFLWLTVYFDTHPLAYKITEPRLSRALWIFWTTKPYLVLVSPGSVFASTSEIKDKDAFRHFRLCFAACPDEEIAFISKNLVRGIHDFWKIKNESAIDKIIDEDEAVLESTLRRARNLDGPC